MQKTPEVWYMLARIIRNTTGHCFPYDTIVVCDRFKDDAYEEEYLEGEDFFLIHGEYHLSDRDIEPLTPEEVQEFYKFHVEEIKPPKEFKYD